MITINKIVANSIVITTGPASHTDTWYKYAGDTEWKTVSIQGAIVGSDETPTTQIPNVTNVVELEIGSDVTSIGMSAFDRCSGLTSVIIGENVTSIGYEAFYRCQGLTSVTIPDNMTNIAEEAFYKCNNITDVYCYPNPTNLTWGPATDDFDEDNPPQCHVKAEYLTAYQTKFGSTVNVTFIGDLT